jgi:epoxyqueuosine reductase
MSRTGFPRFCDTTSRLSRRDFLASALAAGAFLPQSRGQRGRGRRHRSSVERIDPSQIPAYQYRTLSLSHFPALQDEYEKTRSNGQLSRNKVFRNEITPLSFKPPGDFPDAKSVVVVAAFARTMYANFHLDGQVYRILVPFQYYRDELNPESLENIVQKDIIKESGHRVVDITERVPLKLLAARSGLGRYGRNNLIFVSPMGSFNVLYAFLTDYSFPDDSWSALDILDACNHCHRCDHICPTNCFSRRSFVIDIDRCITLYNENTGDFPNWIHRSMHNALMGCMECQSPCPVNEWVDQASGNLEDVSEDETRKILEGTIDDAMLKSLQRKLRGFPADDSRELLPILTRNLGALIRT